MSRSDRHSWFANRHPVHKSSRRRRKSSSGFPSQRKLWLEHLEDRRVLATNVDIAFSPLELYEKENEFDFGQAIDLDGVNDRVNMSLGNGNFNEITHALTIEAWFKVDTFDVANQTIISKGDIWTIQRSGTTNTIEFVLQSGFVLNSSLDVADGNWHHVRATIDGSGFAFLDFFIDGELQDSQLELNQGLDTNAFAFLVGANQAVPGRNFNGQIDEVRVWSVPDEQVPSRTTPLTGNEEGLVVYYNFDDGTATDLSGSGNDGSLLGSPTFVDSYSPSIIGFVDIELTDSVSGLPDPVNNVTGMIVSYALSGSATEGEDYYITQVDLSTTDANPPIEGILIPEGASSARIAIAALNDAFLEGLEDVTITLQDVVDPFGNSYDLGSSFSTTIDLVDAGNFVPGTSLINVFGENAVSQGLAVDPSGEASVFVKLESEPTNNVTVNVSSGLGGLSTNVLTFTDADWYIAQEVVVNGLAAFITDDNVSDEIDTLTFSFSSSDSDYNGINRNVDVFDTFDSVKLNVDEGGSTQTITPTVSIRNTRDVTEGEAETGIFTISTDVAAPEGGLQVFYNLSDASLLGSQYDLIDAEGTNSGFVVIPEGQYAATILVEAIDDSLVDGTVVVDVDLVADVAYDIDPLFDDAQVDVLDEDVASIETAILTNVGALDTTFEQSVDVDAFFNFDVTSFSLRDGGATATISVSLAEAPSNNVVVTLDDVNSLGSGQLTFTPGNYDTPQSLTLDFSEAGDLGLELSATTDANGDSNYGSLSISLPFFRAATPFDENTSLSTSEAGNNLAFAVRLNSQPTSSVSVTLDSGDPSEGDLSTVLNFDDTNWSDYQIVTVVGQDDSMDDGNVTYLISIDSSSGDSNFNQLSADFQVINRDDELEEDPNFDTTDSEAEIIVGITPLFVTSGEGGNATQFQITLSELAPAGGLTVEYVIHEGSATRFDIDASVFFERTGDANPLAATQLTAGEIASAVNSVPFGDFDNDGDQDVLFVLSGQTTLYYENIGTAELPEFVENASVNPLASTAGFGVSLTDFDEDGDLDIIQINSSQNGILYFENQLIGSGVLSFVELTGGANPFDGLTLDGAYATSVVDIDDNGQLDLFIIGTMGINTYYIDHFEYTGSSFVAGTNPLAGQATGFQETLAFTDLDEDGDLDLFLGGINSIRYLENVGSADAPIFVERFLEDNPLSNISGGVLVPSFVDIDNNGSLDLFVGDIISVGETSDIAALRFFEATGTQEAFVPEGATSAIVSVPVVDDDIDEGDESFQVSLVSNLSERYDLQTTSVWDNQFTVVVTEAYDSSFGNVEVTLDPTSVQAISDAFLPVGTVLNFSGGAVGTLVTVGGIGIGIADTLFVTLDPGGSQTIGVGETATLQFPETTRILAEGNFDGSTVALRVGGAMVSESVSLVAGTQLTFSNGAVYTVDEKTVINKFVPTLVPMTKVSGSDFVNFNSAELTLSHGEIAILLDDIDDENYGLSAGTRIQFDNGAILEVTSNASLASPVPGDFDLSGVVDGVDLALWQSSYGQSGSGLAADADNNGFVDGLDFLTWQQNFGKTGPNGTGVYVTGFLVSGTTIPSGATASILQTGYRVSANLEVTGDFSSGSVSLRIDEAAYSNFILPAGTLLTFSNGATILVDDNTLLNNSTGVPVSVTLAADSSSSTIVVGEGTDTSDFFTEVAFEVVGSAEESNFLPVQITTPGVTSFTVPTGTPLEFSGGATVIVLSDSTINDTGVGSELELMVAPGSIIEFLDDIVIGETSTAFDINIVSSTELVLQDNDTAGVSFAPTGTTTSEAGGSQTIDVVLDSQPTSNVTVFLGVDGGEALLSDVDESDQSSIELLFTPLNWNVVQPVTVTGVDDAINDGDVNYTINVTVASTDVEYTDDTISASPVEEFDLSQTSSEFFLLNEITVPDTTISNGTILNLTNGAQLQVVTGDTTIENEEPSFLVWTELNGVDQIGTNRTATVYDGDFQTSIAVTADYNSGSGSVGLQLSDSSVLDVTLLAGKTLIFSNGTRAVVNSDVTLNNSSGVTASITLIEGTSITTADTTFIEENLIVTTAYDADDLTIGMEVDDLLIGAITFAASTMFEFSNGAVGTIASQTTFSNSSEAETAITVDPDIVTSQAVFYYTEQLVAPLAFTNTDDDQAGITVTQFDPVIAMTEGFSNNFFTVVLDTEPTTAVDVVLTPSDANISLADEFIGEPLAITFNPLNWNIPQSVELSAVDDGELEYSHFSTIGISVNTTAPEYSSVALPNDIEVFIDDNELPVATVVAVADAIENSAPGYFVIELSDPAPAGVGETGIQVSYTLSGTVDVDGTGDTDDFFPITGSAIIAPGETRSEIIAFPIDDFLDEPIGGATGDVETLSVTLNASSEYELGNSSSADIRVTDDDEAGVRIVQTGSSTILSEGEAGSEILISLLSQPTDPVTVNLSVINDTQTIQAEQAYNSSDTSVSLMVTGSDVNSLLLPAATYNFPTGTIELSSDVTIFAGEFTNVSAVTVTGTVAVDDTADYTYQELGLDGSNPTHQLNFDSNDWWVLQSVPVSALDDLVVETGQSHIASLDISLVTADTSYSSLTIPDFDIDVIDRQLDVEETYLSLSQGFLALQDSIENVTLPIVGDFGEVAPSFIEEFLAGFVDEIRTTDNLTAQTLADAFGVALTDAVGIDVFSFEITSISSDELGFLISVSDEQTIPIELTGDLGLEALNIGIESEGSVDLTAAYSISLGFGINTTDGFYLDTTTTGFDVAASLTLSDDFSATGELGFIQLDIGNAVDPVDVIATAPFDDTVDVEIGLEIDDPAVTSYVLEAGSTITFNDGAELVVTDETEIFFGAATLVAISSATGPVSQDETGVGGDTDGTALDTSFSISLQDINDTNGNTDQLTLSELISARGGSPFDYLSYSFVGDAALDLDITTSVSGSAAFPSFSFNLFSSLPLFNYSNQADADSAGGEFDLQFNDITLDVGSFVTDLLSPVIDGINSVFAPFEPVLSVLNSELEVLSAIGLVDTFDQNDDGEATLIEVALTLAGGLKNGNTAAKFTKFIDAVTGVIELAELFEDLSAADSLAINFGSYMLEDFRGASNTADAAMVDPETDGMAEQPAMDPEDQAMDTGNNKVNGVFAKLDNLGFTIDILENPLNVIKLFLGQDIDLITWDAPELDLSFEIERSFPIVLGISGEITGEFSVYSDLFFGFDTFGLSQWKEKDFALQQSYLVFDGFYVSDVDPETGEDVDELTLEATIRIGVELNAVVAQFSGGGGITGSAALDLIDVGERSGESDGRLRGSEILANINRPNNLFAVSGAIEAFLDLSISVGIDLGFWEATKTVWERELARITLFEFEFGGGGGGSSLTSTIVDTSGGLSSSGTESTAADSQISQATNHDVEPSSIVFESPSPAPVALPLEEASITSSSVDLVARDRQPDIVPQLSTEIFATDWILVGSHLRNERPEFADSADFSFWQREHDAEHYGLVWELAPASRYERFTHLRDDYTETANYPARELEDPEQESERGLEALETAFATFR